MATSLTDFLLTLSNDPSLLAQYRQDPAAVIQAAGLSDQDRDALLSGDPVTIRQALGASTPVTAGSYVVIIVVARTQ